MAKRFNNLEDVYNTLLAAGFDFNTLSSTNKYRIFKEWKQDPDKRKRADGSVPASGRKQAIGLLAFGLDDGGGDDDKLVIQLGKRAFDYWNGLTGKTVFGLVPTPGDTYKKLTGYTPAKAILGKYIGTNTTSGTTPKSKITGREYKKTIDDSYTIPFGKGTTATAREIDRQDEILANTSLNTAHSITFTPEKLSRR